MGKKLVGDLHFIEDSSDEIFLSEIFLRNDQVQVKLHHHLGLREFQMYLLEHPERRPDLLLVDLNLPGTKGTALIEDILGDENGPDLVAGICTGSEDPQDRLEASNSGAHFFVNKPLNLNCLKHICKSVGELSMETDNSGQTTLYRH